MTAIYLHIARILSLINEQDIVQEGGAVREGWQKNRELESERQREREKLLDICFVLSLQSPQDNSAGIAQLKHWMKSEIL